MNRLVIFDLDGVLFESKDMHHDALNRALISSGHLPISDMERPRFEGRPTRVKLDMLGIRDDDAEEVMREKQAHTLGWIMRNVRRNDGLVELFKHLRMNGWQIAVASNAITVTVVRALQLLGLWDLCDFVAAGDRYAPKPNPEMYLRCMEERGATPLTTIIVEDSPVGVEGARKTGAAVVLVTYPEVISLVMRAVQGDL